VVVVVVAVIIVFSFLWLLHVCGTVCHHQRLGLLSHFWWKTKSHLLGFSISYIFDRNLALYPLTGS